MTEQTDAPETDTDTRSEDQSGAAPEDRSETASEDGSETGSEGSGSGLPDPEEVPEEEIEEIEETREERLDPDNRPDGAEVDNTDRTFDAKAGMFTDNPDYSEDEKQYDPDADDAEG